MTDNRTKTAEALKGVLGDLYSLYLKTHGYHWNVEGPRFRSLHLLFEENYRAMWATMDEVAERMRALGVYAPSGAKELGAASRIDSDDNGVPSADAMIQNLITGHEAFINGANDAMDIAADAGDAATEDLLTQLVASHEKMAWMLRSSLER